jgi:hypothetical protein
VAPHQHKKVLIDYEDIPDIGEICAHETFVLSIAPMNHGFLTELKAMERLQKIHIKKREKKLHGAFQELESFRDKYHTGYPLGYLVHASAIRAERT